VTPLAPAERAALLGLARAAVRHHLGLGSPPPLPEGGALGEPRGAFVTLHVRGTLRGCVGSFTPRGSLARTVAAMAVEAATRDPRFPPLAAEELDDVDLHISALGPLLVLARPEQLVVGRHGLVVRRGWYRGALLPHVARDAGWDARTFLERTCLKAGLPPSAWREADAVVEAFEAEEFGVAEPG
jgi:AmmeMemoRadiSam system protein A